MSIIQRTTKRNKKKRKKELSEEELQSKVSAVSCCSRIMAKVDSHSVSL